MSHYFVNNYICNVILSTLAEADLHECSTAPWEEDCDKIPYTSDSEAVEVHDSSLRRETPPMRKEGFFVCFSTGCLMQEGGVDNTFSHLARQWRIY